MSGHVIKAFKDLLKGMTFTREMNKEIIEKAVRELGLKNFSLSSNEISRYDSTKEYLKDKK